MAIKYYELTEEKRIAITSDRGRLVKQEDNTIVIDGESFDFPEGFDFGKQYDYKLVDGELVYDPVLEFEEEATQLDKIEAQVAYTAMMTNTLLGD